MACKNEVLDILVKQLLPEVSSCYGDFSVLKLVSYSGKSKFTVLLYQDRHADLLSMSNRSR